MHKTLRFELLSLKRRFESENLWILAVVFVCRSGQWVFQGYIFHVVVSLAFGLMGGAGMRRLDPDQEHGTKHGGDGCSTQSEHSARHGSDRYCQGCCRESLSRNRLLRRHPRPGDPRLRRSCKHPHPLFSFSSQPIVFLLSKLFMIEAKSTVPEFPFSLSSNSRTTRDLK